MAERMRVDELARRAGVPTTTVRLYRTRGLLPPPTLEGRTGWYDESHLARLRLIARLRADGFSLAAIGALLATWEAGRDLGALVGVERQLDRLLAAPEPLELEPAELAARLPGVAVTPEVLQRAIGLGLVELLDDGRVRVPDPRFLSTGAELAALGVPVDAILDEWAALVDATDAIAERFINVFESHLLPDGWRELDADGTAALATTLARLRAVAGEVVAAALDASIARAGARRLGDLAGRTAPAHE